MKTLSAMAAVAVALVLAVAGCGGGSSGSKPDSTATAPSAPATTSTPAGGSGAGKAPTYADVKKLALTEPEVKKDCVKEVEDVKVDDTPPGETGERFYCQNLEIFEYSNGPKSFAKNFAAARQQAGQPLWVLGKTAYVDVEDSIVTPKGFAKKVQQSCGCGQVVPNGK